MTAATQHAPGPSEVDIEHHLPSGWGAGFSGKLLFAIAIVFSCFQIATSIYAILPVQVLRAVHVGFLVLVACALIANHTAKTPALKAFGWAVGLAGFAIGLYHWIFYIDLVNRAGELNHLDFSIGLVSLVIQIGRAHV